MIFGKKSDVQKHISGKHSMFSHKPFVDDAPPRTAEPTRDDQASAEQSSPSRGDPPEMNPSQS
jgi:hypothetical protein